MKHPMDYTDNELRSLTIEDDDRPPLWLLQIEMGRRGWYGKIWEPMLPEDDAELDYDVAEMWKRMKVALYQ